MTKDSRLEGEEADVQRDLDSEDMRFSSHRKKSESSSDGEEGYVSVDDNENSSKASELEMSLLEDLARCSINRPTQKLDVKAITKSLDQCKIGNVKSLFDSTGKEASRKNKHDVKSDKNQLKTNDTEVKTKDKPKIDIADVLFRKMNAKISKAAVSKDSKESPDKITPKDKVKTVSKDVARAAPENYNCEIMIRTTKGKYDSSNGSNKVICVTITKGSKSDGDSKSDSKEMVQAKKGGKNLFLLSRGPVARRSIADSFSPYTRTQVNQWSGGEIVLSKELTTTPATLPLIANTLLNNSFSYTHPFNLLADNFTGSFNATIGDDSLRIQAWEGQTNQTTTDLDFSQISAKELVLIHNLIDKIINAKDLGTTHNLIDELNRLTPAIYSTKSVNTFEISNEDSDTCHIMRKTRFDTYVSQSSDNSDASFEEFHSSNSSNGPNSDDYSSPVNQWINSPDQCYLSPNTERIENNVQYNLYGESFAEELKPPSAKIDENLFNEMFFDLDMTNRVTNDADILSSSMLPDYNQILLQPAQNIGQTFDNVVLLCDDTKSSFSGDETKDERIREITSQLEAIAGNLAPTTQESVYRNSKFVQILPKDLKCCNTNKKSATKALDESFEKLDTNLKVLMSTKVHSLSEESVPMLLDCLLLKWNNPDEIKFHRLPYMYMICTRLLMQASTARKFFKPYANGHTVLDRAILTCAYPLLTTFLAECSIKAKKKLLEEANEEYFIDNYDSSGNGILHRAVLGGAKCVNSLTGLLDLNKEEQFIDVERTNNDGYTALHLACGKHVSQSGEFKCSCLCMTHVLLEHGNVNPNTKDRMSGNTALHTAVTNHSCAPQLVDCLLRYKADTSLKNYKASTPLDFAKSVSRSSKSSPTKIVVDLMKQQMNVGARQRANKT